MDLIIAGDLMPTKSNFELFNIGDCNRLLGEELLDIWNNQDIRIFNLEGPLSDKENPISKCGPNLIAPISTINGIKKLNPTLITLANNHIFDQGNYGLESTINLLKRYNISYVGAGKNIEEAKNAFIFEQNDKKVGVYACAEHEFSIADENKPGANPFDVLNSFDHISELKEKCDYIIILYHGGKENYRYPSPYLQRVCRKMVDKGADLIICQHSHCIGCYEKYNNSTIIYGQGNFIFDYSDNEYCQTSLLVKVRIYDKVQIEYIPIIKKGNVIGLADSDVKKDILEDYEKRSKEIISEKFVSEKYDQFAEEILVNYLRKLSASGKWRNRIDRYLFRGNLIKRKYKKSNMMNIYNYIECESHRELLSRGLLYSTRRGD